MVCKLGNNPSMGHNCHLNYSPALDCRFKNTAITVIIASVVVTNLDQQSVKDEDDSEGDDDSGDNDSREFKIYDVTTATTPQILHV